MKPKPIITNYKGYKIQYKRIHDLWQWKKDDGAFVFMPITYPHSAKTLKKAKAKIDAKLKGESAQ